MAEQDKGISLKRLLILVLIGIVLALGVRAYIIEGVYASTISMEPTLPVKQFVFVLKCWYVFTNPCRGDIVLLNQEGEGVLKRVIGLPGDTVQEIGKTVYINQQKIDEPYAVHKDPQYADSRDNMEPLTLAQDAYFVMGDNRDFSKDSRVWGPINRNQIKGKVILIKF